MINNRHGNHERWLKEFEELYGKDNSFKEYIDNKKIDFRSAFSGVSSPGSTERKIAPRVAFRNCYLNSAGHRKGRSTIPEDFYSGWDAITRISEGNPRWLIATLNKLLSEVKENFVARDKQCSKIKSAATTFDAMIATTALNDNMGVSTSTPPHDLIHKIGDYFNRQLITEKFSPDPPGTFEVDGYISEDVENSLRIALNHGAIVSLDEIQDIWEYKSLKGKRFRISYLLSPVLELPLRMEKSIQLSTILKDSSGKGSLSVQRGLFS